MILKIILRLHYPIHYKFDIWHDIDHQFLHDFLNHPYAQESMQNESIINSFLPMQIIRL